MKKYFFIIFICCNLFADVGNYYGASSQTAGIGSQLNYEAQDCSNLYYAPSALSNINENKFSLNSMIVSHNLGEIKNVNTKNKLNSNEESDNGDINPNKAPAVYHITHACIPFIKRFNSTLGLSYTAPIDEFMEVNSAETFEPYFYTSATQEKRTIIRLNYIQKLNENWSFSLGQKTSFNIYGGTDFLTRYVGDDLDSSGKMDFKTKPSNAIIFSSSYEHSLKNSIFYFTYSDELKSEMITSAKGYTPLGDASAKFDLTLSSLIFYDPKTYTLGSSFKFNSKSLLALTIEYQDWSGFYTNKLKIKKNSGIIKGSKNFDKSKGQQIIIPKIGYKFNQESSSFLMGYFYRPRAIISNLNSGGNLIDLDSHNISLGYKKDLQTLNWPIELSVSFARKIYNQLEVNKTSKREDNEDGEKIGATSYLAKGYIDTLIFGINWSI